MKNLQRGFLVGFILITIAVLGIVGGIYYHLKNKGAVDGASNIPQAKTTTQTETENTSKSQKSISTTNSNMKVFPFKISVFDGGTFDSPFRKKAEITISKNNLVLASVTTEVSSYIFSIPAGMYSVFIKAEGYKEENRSIIVGAINDIGHNQAAFSLHPNRI